MPDAFFLPSRFWADLSTRDFAALKASGQAEQVVAVLPVAAIEQHGPHLPLSVDATLLQGVIDAALPQLPAELPVLFLPPQNVGLSPEHIRFPGTLTLSPATVIALWTEIGECVARAGIQKLLLFNGHGGQVSVMDIVARELRTRCDLIVYSASWFSLPLPDAVAGARCSIIDVSISPAWMPKRCSSALNWPATASGRGRLNQLAL